MYVTAHACTKCFPMAPMAAFALQETLMDQFTVSAYEQISVFSSEKKMVEEEIFAACACLCVCVWKERGGVLQRSLCG